MKKILSWLNENIENIIIFPSYFLAMAIMAIEVIQRMWGDSWPWANYVCMTLFCWFSWVGCSWNIKERAHLRLGSFRGKLSRGMQLFLLMLDYALWIFFAVVATKAVLGLIIRNFEMQGIIYGTSIPTWLGPIFLPVAFALLTLRVLQCVKTDIGDFRSGRPLKLEPTTQIDV